MLHGLLSLGLAAEGLEIGGELRLDLVARALQEPGAPELSAGVSRGAFMLTAKPIDTIEVFVLADISDGHPDTVVYADDGSRVVVPGGWSPSLLEAHLIWRSESVGLGLGRQGSVMGVAQWGHTTALRRPGFWMGPVPTVDEALGFTPRSIDGVRLFAEGGPLRLDLQSFLDEGLPGAEARALVSIGTRPHLLVAGRRHDARWSWSAAVLWRGPRLDAYLLGYGQGEQVTAGAHLAWKSPLEGLELNLRAWYSDPSQQGTRDATWSVAGGTDIIGSGDLSSGLWWRMTVPEDTGFAIEHDAGLQVRAWF